MENSEFKEFTERSYWCNTLDVWEHKQCDGEFIDEEGEKDCECDCHK